METPLRKLLIVCGVALIFLGGLNFIQYVVFYSLHLIGLNFFAEYQTLKFGLLSLLSTFLTTFQPMGIGALCLYAAHKIRPLQKPFGKK